MAAALKHRAATIADLPAIEHLMARAMAALLPQFLDPAQIAASRAVMGLDTTLIDDGNYVLVFADDALAGCGGWSDRATEYGGDHSAGRDARRLDPASKPARIRAMYTDPDHIRRGVGRRVLELCEDAAAARGFASVMLVATMAGLPLYEACGYRVVERFDDVTGGVAVPLARMTKALSRATALG